MLKRLIVLFTILPFGIYAQTVLLNEDFNSGLPATWSTINGDNLTPATEVDSFDQAWIPFNYNGDTCVASTSYYSPAGQSEDFLVTPKITIGTYSKLVWSARSYDASYPDNYVVLISTTDSLEVSFTDTLFYQEEENFYWQQRSVHLDLEGYANQDIYVAFKNCTTDGFILLLDDIKISTSENASIVESQSAEMIIYPNPTSDFIFIKGFVEGNTVNIYNMSGDLILTSNQPEISLQQLLSGTYICEIISQENNQRIKIQKF